MKTLQIEIPPGPFDKVCGFWHVGELGPGPDRVHYVKDIAYVTLLETLGWPIFVAADDYAVFLAKLLVADPQMIQQICSDCAYNSRRWHVPRWNTARKTSGEVIVPAVYGTPP